MTSKSTTKAAQRVSLGRVKVLTWLKMQAYEMNTENAIAMQALSVFPLHSSKWSFLFFG